MTSMSEASISSQPRIDEPSKPRPSSKISSVSSAERDGEVLPQADEVHELEVHHHRAAFLGETQDVLWFHSALLGRLLESFVGGQSLSH